MYVGKEDSTGSQWTEQKDDLIQPVSGCHIHSHYYCLCVCSRVLGHIYSPTDLPLTSSFIQAQHIDHVCKL